MVHLTLQFDRRLGTVDFGEQAVIILVPAPGGQGQGSGPGSGNRPSGPPGPPGREIGNNQGKKENKKKGRGKRSTTAEWIQASLDFHGGDHPYFKAKFGLTGKCF